MKSVFLILFSTKRGLDYLDKQDELDLNIKSIFLLLFYGMTVFFLIIDLKMVLINPFLDLMFIISIFIFLGLLMSLILHRINMWLIGSGSFSDVFAIISHASVPFILCFISVFFLKKILFLNPPFNLVVFYYLSWIISAKILIQGFLKYNNLDLTKMIINLSPVILLYIGNLLLLIYI